MFEDGKPLIDWGDIEDPDDRDESVDAPGLFGPSDPVEPTPVEPTPVEPTPVEPTPVEPTPVDTDAEPQGETWTTVPPPPPPPPPPAPPVGVTNERVRPPIVSYEPLDVDESASVATQLTQMRLRINRQQQQIEALARSAQSARAELAETKSELSVMRASLDFLRRTSVDRSELSAVRNEIDKLDWQLGRLTKGAKPAPRAAEATSEADGLFTAWADDHHG